MERILSLPGVAKFVDMQPLQQSIPSASKKNFHLPPWAFDFSESAKYGSTGRFPSNHQFRAHFPSFLQNGLECHREALDVKFVLNKDDPAQYKVHPFTVGFVDGQNKALIIQSIFGLLIGLVLGSVIPLKLSVPALRTSPMKRSRRMRACARCWPASATSGVTTSALRMKSTTCLSP